jgi:glycosyltransferase involved in cell wall biosynthesis
MDDTLSKNQLDISVILPVFNGGIYLIDSVESVLSQADANFEFLILDDCSTDGSREYLKNINNDYTFIYYNDVNKGLFFNLNFLVQKSRGKLIKLWAQDDIMYPYCLQQFISFHKQNINIGFSYSDRDIIDENGLIKIETRIDDTPNIISSELHARIAFFTGSIAGNIANVCISKNALLAVGPFREDMKISADFDMWVRLAKDYETGFIKQKLIKLRDHKKQLSRNESFYICHVREDRQVYKYLFSYVNQKLKQEGKEMLRQHKLVFYYTLMLKALMKGRISLAFQFYKELNKFDNFFILSYYFFKTKLFKVKKPSFA